MPGVRVGRLQEHAAVLKGLWSEGPFSFRGEHYTHTRMTPMFANGSMRGESRVTWEHVFQFS